MISTTRIAALSILAAAQAIGATFEAGIGIQFANPTDRAPQYSWPGTVVRGFTRTVPSISVQQSWGNWGLGGRYRYLGRFRVTGISENYAGMPANPGGPIVQVVNSIEETAHAMVLSGERIVQLGDSLDLRLRAGVAGLYSTRRWDEKHGNGRHDTEHRWGASPYVCGGLGWRLANEWSGEVSCEWLRPDTFAYRDSTVLSVSLARQF